LHLFAIFTFALPNSPKTHFKRPKSLSNRQISFQTNFKRSKSFSNKIFLPNRLSWAVFCYNGQKFLSEGLK